MTRSHHFVSAESFYGQGATPEAVLVMNHRAFVVLRRVSPAVLVMILLAVSSPAQEVARGPDSPLDRYEKKTYIERNGTWQWTRTIETEHHVSSDGELDIQRLRAPGYEGDESISWEREVRTRRLPDGTVERQFILLNPDGSGQLAPVQIIREKSTSGGDSTVLQREALERPGGTDWQPVQKERVTEKGPEDAKRAFKEVQRLNLTTHQWETIEQEISSTSMRTEGSTTESDMKSVKQSPDAYGKLADSERREERIVSMDDKQTTESTVYLRDNSTMDPVRVYLYLLDHNTTQVTLEPGTTTAHLVRKSDLLLDHNGRTYSGHPEVVEERTTVEKTAPDGSVHTVTNVVGRTSAEPWLLRPIYTVIQNTDSGGYVRRFYIPAR